MRSTLPLLALLFIAAAGCRARSGVDAGAALDPDWLAGRLPPERGTPTDGGTLTIRVMSEPAGLNHLDDAFRDGWVSRITRNLVTEALLTIDPVTYALEPQLAASWSDSADHRATTFSLRTDATFSDGARLTARDVIATFDAAMDPGRPTGAVRGELAGLERWEALDEATVRLTWRTPSPFALRAVARLPVLQAAQLTGDWAELAKSPRGTGPYVVAEWRRGEALTLTRRAGAPAHLDRVVFRFVKDHAVAAAMFEKGEFDLMTNIQPALWRALERPTPDTAWARTGWHRIRSADNSYSYIGWNEARAHLADPRVRVALAHLYDAELVSRTVDLELELPTTCPYFREGDSCSKAVRPLPFSPSAARALLADAGFTDPDGDGVLERDGAPLRFSFLLPSASVRLGKLVPLLQEQLLPVGIAMEVEKVETATLSARVARRDFDVVSRVWTEFDREQDLFPMFHSSQRDGGANFVGFEDAEVDRLLEAIRREFAPPRRRGLEQQLHERLYSLQPYLFMTTRQSLDAARKRVHGLTPSLLWYDIRAVWVED